MRKTIEQIRALLGQNYCEYVLVFCYTYRMRRSRKQKKEAQKFLFIFLSIAVIFIPLFVFFYTLYIQYAPQIYFTQEETEMTTPPAEIKPVLDTLATQPASYVIPILMYHYVEIVKDKGDTIRQSLNTPPSILVNQIETLKKAGYTFLTMATVGEILLGKTKLPPKPIVLTFDDGYRDLYTDVLPILKKQNVKAVAYIVPGFYDKPNYLYRWQIYELANSGLVEIGAHTVHHVYLKGFPITAAKYEIEQSKTMLEDTLHIPIVSFAYPYGAFDTQAIQLVKQAGFTTAVSTLSGIYVNNTNRFFLYRIRPGRRVGGTLLEYLKQLPKTNP